MGAGVTAAPQRGQLWRRGPKAASIRFLAAVQVAYGVVLDAVRMHPNVGTGDVGPAVGGALGARPGLFLWHVDKVRERGAGRDLSSFAGIPTVDSVDSVDIGLFVQVSRVLTRCPHLDQSECGRP